MTTFDEREEGFERKFVEDEALEFKATARRNRLLGLWAGELMGLKRPASTTTPPPSSAPTSTTPGDEDVLRRVSRDLEGAGIKVSEGQVRGKMDELLAIARGQIQAGE